MVKTFGMISLGCDKNRVDGERLLGEIKRHGCPITDDLSKTQVLIVNTCAFLNAAREESIDTIIGADAYRTDGVLEKIVVTGCLSEKFATEIFPSLTEADVLLGVNDAQALFPALERAYSGERVNAVGEGARIQEKISAERVISTPPHLKYLKISDGCFHRCTYCLIPKIRGKYKSVPMEELIAEAKSLGETQEIVLVAQDTTRYGEDTGENKFVELIQKISKLDNICHIRLLYCYPDAIGDSLIAEVRDNPKVIKYLDIPLQHSENRILKLMGRKGSREEYLALIAKLRQEIPDIAIRTTFIAGFPSETEEEHADMISFLEEVKFTNCGFFAYSREPETGAYNMKGQIPARVKQKRVRELYRAQARISAEYLRSYEGQTVQVLCDGIDYDRQCFAGRAYFQASEIDGNVFFTAEKATVGKLCTVKITRTDTYDLYGVKV